MEAKFNFPVYNPPKNIIFLDVDGVLNCEIFYEERYKEIIKYNNIPFYKQVKKVLKKLVKRKDLGKLDYYKRQFDPRRIQWLNGLCEDTGAAVVLSASMRSRWSPLELNEIFQYAGATFTIIGKTGHCDCRVRGVEIKKWLEDNCMYWFGVNYYDFHRYAIIDDDSDMLLNQQHNFFHTDNYSGLTPNTCYKIRRFFTHKAF
jgi:hypothetical protein